MTKDLMATHKNAVITDKDIKSYLTSTKTTLTDDQFSLFAEIAKRNGLDPFKREIYPIPFGGDFSIVTGYEVYIQRAERTGKLAGWSCVNVEEGAVITIHRTDWKEPFIWEVTYEEFKKQHATWKSMPKFMIKKVCIGQGFRLAFPDELAGMPYLKEEMEGGQPFMKEADVQKTQSLSSQTESQEEETVPLEAESEPGDETATKPLSENEVMTKIAKVTLQKSPADAKKPWTKYIVHSVGGTEYTTFDEEIAKAARRAAKCNLECLICFTYMEKFKANQIDLFTVMEDE